jgi:hypothetical protein
VVALIVVAVAGCSPSAPTPPGPSAAAAFSPSLTPASAAATTTSAPSAGSPSPILQTPIPTPDPTQSLPTPITARIDLTGPTGFRQVTSAVTLGGAIWVSQYQHVGAWLVRVDPVTARITLTRTLPSTIAPAELAAGNHGSLWVDTIPGATGGESTPNGTVARIDPTTGAVIAQAELPVQGQIAPGTGVVWVPGGSKLQRLDAASLKVTATFPAAGQPSTQCALSVTQAASTSTAFYLDPDGGNVTATIDLGVGGRLLGNDPVEGTDNCWALVGPPSSADPAKTGSTLAEIGLENTMVVAAQSPPFQGDVRFAGGTFWLLANRTMTAIDPLTLAPLGPTWQLPSDVGDPSSWTLLGAGGTLWWVGPSEALRVGIPIPTKAAAGEISSQPWAGPLTPVAAAFSDLDHGILAGATGNGAGAGVVATTSDGGRTWTKRLLASPPLFGVTFHGSLVLATAACQPDAPPGCQTSLLRSTDGGLTWTAASDGLDGVELASASTAWAIYNPTIHAAGVASSPDRGRTWQRYRSPCLSGFPVFEPSGISFPTPTKGWLVCDGGGAMGSSAKALFHTVNAGKTWRTLFVQSLGAGGVSSGPANEALLGGDFAGIDFLADGTGWLTTGDGLFVTHDGGLSWRLVGFADGAGGLQIDAMNLLSATTGIVLVTNLTVSPAEITLQETTDAGSSWVTVATWPLAN